MASAKKSHNVFAHSPSLQLLWKCASQRRLVTKTLINSVNFKSTYNDVLNYVNSKTRRRSPLALILDSHLMLGLVYIYSKTVIIWHQDVEKLYKDAVVHRFFEFDVPTKTKLTRKKQAILATAPWQIDIDEHLLPDERVLLERDFSIEIPRQATPPIIGESPDNLPPLPWEVSKPSHGKRITLLPDIEEPMPKFDLIDDRFGEPLPVTGATAMDVDQREDRTFFRAASEDRTTELLRAPRVDRHAGASDRYIHPSEERTADEHRRVRSMASDLPPLPMPTLDTTLTGADQPADRFSVDALAFFTSSMNTYPIYPSTSTNMVLLGADCISASDIPMIVIQEPTMIGADELPVPMDIQHPHDQQLPMDGQVPTTGPAIDAQVPDAMVTSADEKEYLHMSKKKRHAPSAINKKRKYPALYNQIVNFDYGLLRTMEDEEDEIWKQRQEQQIPWPTLVGRDGKKRMQILLDKAKITIAPSDLRIMIDDVTRIAQMLMNPDEAEGLAEARRTGQEIAIRRGQSSGLLPRPGTRSPSSLVPTIQDRASQLPLPILGGDVLPPFPSGFDEIPLVAPPSEPLKDLRQPMSPLQTSRRGRIQAATSVEPSPTWQDKQKRKAIDELLNVADNPDGGSFNQFLNQSQSTRIQAARFFSILLVLCAEGRIRPLQKEPYAEIKLLAHDQYNPMKGNGNDVQQEKLASEPMENDDDDNDDFRF